MTKMSAKKTQAGFSLVELLIAMFVMAVGLSAIAILFTMIFGVRAASTKRGR